MALNQINYLPVLPFHINAFSFTGILPFSLPELLLLDVVYCKKVFVIGLQVESSNAFFPPSHKAKASYTTHSQSQFPS